MSQLIDEVQLYTDGGCRGNPGPGAIGMIVMDADEHELFAGAECIGHVTNNRAEYRALINGLDLRATYTRGRVVCYSDSELLINQMSGAYRLKNEELRVLWQRAKDLEQVFHEVVYRHIRRTNPFIVKADRLLNDAFDRRDAISLELDGGF